MGDETEIKRGKNKSTEHKTFKSSEKKVSNLDQSCFMSCHVVVSINSGEDVMRCGQLSMFLHRSHFGKAEWLDNKKGQWLGLTCAHIFLTTAHPTENILGKIAYNGTWLEEDKKAFIVTDPKTIHVNRKMGEVVRANLEKDVCLVLIDHDFELNPEKIQTIKDQTKIPSGTKIKKVTTYGKEHFINRHPTQPSWIKWQDITLSDEERQRRPPPVEAVVV
jgi:hypothetical protein